MIALVNGVRFNAKEINSNFQAINSQLTTLEQKMNFLKNRTLFYESYLRNSTGKHFLIQDLVKRLHRRINDIDILQKRNQNDQDELEKSVARHTLLIHTSNTNLQNKINDYHNALLRRLEKLEQDNTAHKQNNQRVEERLKAESTKNRNLLSLINMLSGDIRSVHNNMTRSINKLRSKHEWLATYLHNKSIEDAQLHNMVRALQVNIRDMQQSLFSLEMKTTEHRLQQKSSQRVTQGMIKEKLLQYLKKHKAKYSSLKTTTTTTTSEPLTPTERPIERITNATLKPKTTITTTTTKKTTTTTAMPTTLATKSQTPKTESTTTTTIKAIKTTTLPITLTTKSQASTTEPTTTTPTMNPMEELAAKITTTTTTVKELESNEDNMKEAELMKHVDNSETSESKPLQDLVELLNDGGYRNILWGR